MEYYYNLTDGFILEAVEGFGKLSGFDLSRYVPCPNYPALPPEVQAMETKRIKREEFEAAIAAGFAEDGITWGITDFDRNSYVQLSELLRNTNAPDTLVVDLVDIHKNKQAMTVASFRGLIVKIGEYVKDLIKERDQ